MSDRLAPTPPAIPAPTSADLRAEVEWTAFDFLDLGCSAGGSIPYCQKRFAARRGLGLDIAPAKVAKARAAGLDAIVADATRLADLPGLQESGHRFRFVSMLHFLEHLTDLAAVEAVLRHAAAVATDFLFIRHPSFEGEAYLAELGLRQYWWAWTSHRTHVRIADLCTVLDRVGLRQYTVGYRRPVWNSLDPTVLCLEEPADEPQFDPMRHRPRPPIRFTQPLWHGQDVVVALRAIATNDWIAITAAD